MFTKYVDVPNEKEWQQHRLDKYGLFTIDQVGNAKQFEKINYPTYQKLVATRNNRVGISLESFSLSLPMTLALLDEFDFELKSKNMLLDSDPHFWMPLTLDLDTYVEIMQKKRVATEETKLHFMRMQLFKNRFCEKYHHRPLFGALDIGSKSYWWDFGNLSSYFENIMKLTSSSKEGESLRLFYNYQNSHNQGRLIQDTNSICINCHIESGHVKNSVLIGVKARDAQIANSVLIDTSVDSLECDRCLLYNVQDQNHLTLDPETIRSDLTIPSTQQKIQVYTKKKRDGKSDWDLKLPQNPYSSKRSIICLNRKWSDLPWKPQHFP